MAEDVAAACAKVDRVINSSELNEVVVALDEADVAEAELEVLAVVGDKILLRT